MLSEVIEVMLSDKEVVKEVIKLFSKELEVEKKKNELRKAFRDFFRTEPDRVLPRTAMKTIIVDKNNNELYDAFIDLFNAIGVIVDEDIIVIDLTTKFSTSKENRHEIDTGNGRLYFEGVFNGFCHMIKVFARPYYEVES